MDPPCKRLRICDKEISEASVSLETFLNPKFEHITNVIFKDLDKKSFKACRLVSKAMKASADESHPGYQLRIQALWSRHKIFKLFTKSMCYESGEISMLGLIKNYTKSDPSLQKLRAVVQFVEEFCDYSDDLTDEYQIYYSFSEGVPETRANYLNNPMLFAIFEDKIDLLENLFANGIMMEFEPLIGGPFEHLIYTNKNVVSIGSVIHLVCYYSKINALKLFIRYWPEIVKESFKYPSPWFQTPLHVACEIGDLDIVKIFFEYRKKLDIDFDRLSIQEFADWLPESKGERYFACSGLTPLYTACKNGHYKIVYFLYKYSSELGIDFGKIRWVKRECDDEYHTETDKGRSILYIACQSENPALVEFLLSLPEVTVNDNFDDDGEPGDHTAFSGACYSRKLKIVEKLLKFKNEKRIDIKYNSPFQTACNEGHIEVVNILLEHYDEGDFNAKGQNGHTLISNALEHGQYEVVRAIQAHAREKNIKLDLEKFREVQENSPEQFYF